MFDRYILIEHSLYVQTVNIINCLDKCEYTLIKQSKYSFASVISSSFSTSLMLEKILSQDDKTGFVIQLYLVFKEHNWGIRGKNLEHCFKA